MALPRDPRGRALVGMIARQQFENRLTREAVRVLERAFRDVVADLAIGNITPRDRAQLQAIASTMAGRVRQAYGVVSAETRAALADYALVESGAAAAELEARVLAATGDASLPVGSFRVLSPTMVQAVADMPIEGLALGEWWDEQAATMSRRTRAAIQAGVLRGQSSRDIVHALVGGEGYRGPVAMRAAVRDATAIVRTARNAIANEAAFRTYVMHADVTREYEYLATRDQRTTPRCRALDGRRFRYDDPRAPRPPQHINCRSTILPVINYGRLGMRDLQADGEALAFPSLASWLREQPVAKQDAVLGRGRGALFRSGDVSLAELVDTDSRTITLDTLARSLGVDRDALRTGQVRRAPTTRRRP